MTRFRRLAATVLAVAVLAVPSLAAAPGVVAEDGPPVFTPIPPIIFPPDREALVTAWYEDFLGHGRSVGITYWIGRTYQQDLADVLWALAHTPEHNTTKIDAYYRFYLDRAPDPGARYWSEGTDAGRFPLEWPAQNILASPEYAELHGGYASEKLIYAWYHDVLGNEAIEGRDRPITSGEIAYWQQRVRDIGALGALRELYYTPEAVQGRISYTYYTLLDREPSAGEIAYWYPKEVESEINVNVLIGATLEYRTVNKSA